MKNQLYLLKKIPTCIQCFFTNIYTWLHRKWSAASTVCYKSSKWPVNMHAHCCLSQLLLYRLRWNSFITLRLSPSVPESLLYDGSVHTDGRTDCSLSREGSSSYLYWRQTLPPTTQPALSLLGFTHLALTNTKEKINWPLRLIKSRVFASLVRPYKKSKTTECSSK